MPIELEVRGLDDVNRRLQRLARGFEDVAAQALREEAEVEMAEAKRRTPVEFGTLRASGHVQFDRDALAAALVFGGPAVPYAIYVHENLEAFHPVGQAKFLESVLLESAPHLPGRVARRMAALIARRV